MAVLTGAEILKEYNSGKIVISPFKKKQLNVKGVSYDVTLMPKIALMLNRYVTEELRKWTSGHIWHTGDEYPDCEEVRQIRDITDRMESLIDGFESNQYLKTKKFVDPADPPDLFHYDLDVCPWMLPGVLYLASTNEKIGSDHFEPVIHGKSSLARLGLSVHETAGLGEPGFKSQWTLEMTCSHPFRLRPNMRIGQVTFETVEGKIDLYKGNYRTQKGPTGSKMNKYFKDGKPV